MTLLRNSLRGTLVTTYANLPPAGQAGRRAVVTDSLVEWVDDGVEWRPEIEGVLGYAPPNVSAFTTAVNASNMTLTNVGGSIRIDSTSTVLDFPRLLTATVYSTPPYWVETCFLYRNNPLNTENRFPFAGPAGMGTNNNETIAARFGTNQGSTFYSMYGGLLTGNAFGIAGNSNLWSLPQDRPVWYRLRYNGSNTTIQVSWDRTNYITVATSTYTIPVRLGITLYSNAVERMFLVSYREGTT